MDHTITLLEDMFKAAKAGNMGAVQAINRQLSPLLNRVFNIPFDESLQNDPRTAPYDTTRNALLYAVTPGMEDSRDTNLRTAEEQIVRLHYAELAPANAH